MNSYIYLKKTIVLEKSVCNLPNKFILLQKFCKEMGCFLEKFTELEKFTQAPVATNFKSVSFGQTFISP